MGNQFGITTVLAFVLSVPFMIAREGARWGRFVELCRTEPALSNNLVASGMFFYLYNELATMTIKKTGAVTASVANTAKRVIVIVGSAVRQRASCHTVSADRIAPRATPPARPTQ